MCGRYTITMDPDLICRHYGAGFPETPRPVFNASPDQHLPVILDAEPGTIQPAYWCFSTEFAGRPRRMLINARAETAHRLPTFRASFRRRCLVVADGFCESKATANGRQPYRVVLQRDGTCTFAGLWKETEDGSGLRDPHDRGESRIPPDPRPDAGDAGPGPVGPVARSRLRDGRTHAPRKAGSIRSRRRSTAQETRGHSSSFPSPRVWSEPSAARPGARLRAIRCGPCMRPETAWGGEVRRRRRRQVPGGSPLSDRSPTDPEAIRVPSTP